MTAADMDAALSFQGPKWPETGSWLWVFADGRRVGRIKKMNPGHWKIAQGPDGRPAGGAFRGKYVAARRLVQMARAMGDA
jgi:hypothetical protein